MASTDKNHQILNNTSIKYSKIQYQQKEILSGIVNTLLKKLITKFTATSIAMILQNSNLTNAFFKIEFDPQDLTIKKLRYTNN